jgi:hypothetical protein
VYVFCCRLIPSGFEFTGGGSLYGISRCSRILTRRIHLTAPDPIHISVPQRLEALVSAKVDVDMAHPSKQWEESASRVVVGVYDEFPHPVPAGILAASRDVSHDSVWGRM